MTGGTIAKIGPVDYAFAEKWYVRIGSTADRKPPHATLEFESDPRGRLKQLAPGDSIVVVGRVVSLQMIDRCEVVG